ncbi:uncharacterized protein EI90DRAFT_3045452 [Cantharellus anzutake]|uniref:uncharacterized protein n=1 Tax=Cantharellus anzutake TaxID=1750568 RepID=UPI0019075E34|nr:uncharacterized protein EI90DRAFT_3045452 [Cantharellus anzutake]KAF8336351.1 hypothetical protein EI90DRAFT_3045452 [Cantharellus anzutake]
MLLGTGYAHGLAELLGYVDYQADRNVSGSRDASLSGIFALLRLSMLQRGFRMISPLVVSDS